jgi:dTDP-glucose 4,6-dehydratase
VNIGSSYELSMRELAERVRTLAASDSTLTSVDLPVDDPKLRRPDTTLASELLGWQPRTSLEEGLKRTLEWFAQTRPEG